MSYDLWLEVDAGGPERTVVCDYWNYTSNCARMWREAGIDLAECDGKDAGGCAEGLAVAIENLKSWSPEKIAEFNPPNGWGSHATLVPALERLLSYWLSAPRAIVRVSH